LKEKESNAFEDQTVELGKRGMEIGEYGNWEKITIFRTNLLS
jgi:hypothetical protein